MTNQALKFIQDVGKNRELREKVYAKFRMLPVGDWQGFAVIGAEHGYDFEGEELKANVPKGFYEQRGKEWKETKHENIIFSPTRTE